MHHDQRDHYTDLNSGEDGIIAWNLTSRVERTTLVDRVIYTVTVERPDIPTPGQGHVPENAGRTRSRALHYARGVLGRHVTLTGCASVSHSRRADGYPARWSTYIVAGA